MVNTLLYIHHVFTLNNFSKFFGMSFFDVIIILEKKEKEKKKPEWCTLFYSFFFLFSFFFFKFILQNIQNVYAEFNQN